MNNQIVIFGSVADCHIERFFKEDDATVLKEKVLSSVCIACTLCLNYSFKTDFRRENLFLAFTASHYQTDRLYKKRLLPFFKKSGQVGVNQLE